MSKPDTSPTSGQKDQRRVGVITVPADPKNASDYDFALESCTWGSPRGPKSGDSSYPRPHDVLLIATGYQRPDPGTKSGYTANPRVSAEVYGRGTFSTAVIVEVTGPIYTSTAPHWPGEDGAKGVRYPHRFPVAQLGVIKNIGIADLPENLRACFHQSISSQSRAVVTEVSPAEADLVASMADIESWRALIDTRPQADVDYVDPFNVRRKSAPKSRDGAGRLQDPEKRKAIELHAEDLAVDHYEELGWTVKRKGAPYDLDCTQDREKLRVEVKGTTGAAGEVELTSNEVLSARDQPSELFVVSNITAVRSTGTDGQVLITTSGGTAHILREWAPHDNDLSATRYRYRLPLEQGETLQVEHSRIHRAAPR